MKKLIVVFAIFAVQALAQQQPKGPVTLRSILLQELRETHTEKNWFVTLKDATAGLTAEQANWTDGKGNHSVGQLVYHLVFWNKQNLATLKGEPKEKFSGDNNETFTHYDSKQWDAVLKEYDDGMTKIEKAVETADDAQLAKWAPNMARIAQHNAYHIAEMVVIRREQGSWNPDNGVK